MKKKNTTYIALSVGVIITSLWIYRSSTDTAATQMGGGLGSEGSDEEASALQSDLSDDGNIPIVTQIREAASIRSFWELQDYDSAAEAFQEWLQNDPEAALHFFAEMRPPLEIQHFLSGVTNHLASQSIEQALELAEQLKSMGDEVYLPAIRESLMQWNAADQPALLNWLQNKTHPGLAALIGQSGVLGESSTSLPEVVSSFPEGEIKNQLASAILGNWLQEDPELAVVYVNELPPTEAFDRAALSYVDQIASVNHDAAHSWADMIVNPELRLSILQELENNHGSGNCEHCASMSDEQ